MKHEKKFWLAIASVALPTMFATIASPVAFAEGAAVESTVTAIDKCAWQIAGVPTSLTLQSTGNAKYVGAALPVSASITNLTLGLSGSLATANATSGLSSECSFYNNKQSADVTFQPASTSTFDATYGASDTPDPDMDFDLNDSALNVGADVSACETWAKNDRVFSAIADTGVSLFGLATEEVENYYDQGDGERCTPRVTLSVEIPASVAAPAGAGQDYSFAGPTLVIAKVVNPAD